MSDTLYIAAKAPRRGFAKTRLGHSIGHEAAVALYKAFLEDLAARFAGAPFAGAPFECGWYVTPPGSWLEIAPLASPNGCEARVLFQKEGDWSRRQRELFRGAPQRGEEKVVLIGSDSPQIAVEVVARAFRELDRADLVLGPTHDGGYYLIGMRSRGPYDVLRDLPMSTGTVLEDISARAGRAGLSLARLEATFDVDEVEDLAYLRQLASRRADLSATRTALEKLAALPEA